MTSSKRTKRRSSAGVKTAEAKTGLSAAAAPALTLKDSVARTRRISPEDVLLGVCAAVLLALIVIQVTFANRPTTGDEDGLYNAMYMYQHYGKVTYPMQLQFDYMTVHPPTHYFVVGLLAKTGLQVFHAAAVPLVLMALIAFVAILSSRFPNLVKFSVLAGFTMGALVYTPLSTIRPDMEVTFAWFCGLALLEAARSCNWENKRLFLGAFFIAYASGLHYPAGVSVLILLAYFLFILWRPESTRPHTKLLAMAAGALLFYVPFAAYFVIPHYHAILEMLKSADATGGGVLNAIRSQYQQLDSWAASAWPPKLSGLGKLVFFPVKDLRLPPIVCAVPVLLAFPALRGLATAGAILPVFIFTMVSRKGGLFYIAPELILYTIAVSLVFFHLVDWLWRRFRNDLPLVPRATSSILAALVLSAAGASAKWGITPVLNDWEVARAASQRIIGGDARVALNQCYAWYASGGSKLYWVVSHVGWDFMDRVNRKRTLDSVLLINDWFANQRATIPFPEFYLEGDLNLHGFYFPGHHDAGDDQKEVGFDQSISMLHLTARKDLPKLGYGYDRERRIVNEYFEDPAGKWIFATFKAFLHFPDQWPPDAEYIQRFDIERPLGNEPELFAIVTAREHWLRDRPHYAEIGTIRDEVRMGMREITPSDLLRGRGPQRIEFMTNQPDLP